MDGSISNRTFKHSGRLGDLVYALPAVKALGGGRLYLDTGAVEGFSDGQAAQAIPLLETQPYITSGSIRHGEVVDYDLDRFRIAASSHTNLARAHLAAFDLDLALCESPWLESDGLGEAEAFEVVFARCLRRHEVLGFWQRAYELFGREAVFVGTPEEHGEFEARFGPIPYAPTPDLKALAALIDRCGLFAGSQSCPYAIAEALGKSCILEVDEDSPNCLFFRGGATHVFGSEDLWKIDQVAESRECDCHPEWEMQRSSPLAFERIALWDELRAIDRFELRLANREPIKVRLAKTKPSSAEELDPGGEPEDPEAFAVPATRSRLETVLLESLYRMTEPDSHRVVHAVPIPRLKDERTLGVLGPATLPGCSVVVLSYNSARTIERCLRQVAGSLGEHDELIVVDNASTDETTAVVQALAGTIPMKFVQNETNLGFSAGCNVGMRASSCRYIALLNPDAYVPSDWIPKLVARFADPLVGAVGPVSNHVAGLQLVGAHLPAGTPPRLSEAELHQVLQANSGRSTLTKLLIGFCLLFRRSTLEKIGLLDEDLFLGSDDLEISLRIRSHGLRLVIARDVLVWHESGNSFASLDNLKKDDLLDRSSKALRDKIVRLYAPGLPPTSRMLWDSTIFEHMLPSPD